MTVRLHCIRRYFHWHISHRGSSCNRKGGWERPGVRGQHGAPGASHPVTRRGVEHSLHVVVGRILTDVADIENDGFFAEVLPPMRGAIDLLPQVTRLVYDRIDAVAGVFYNLAL